MSNSKLFKDMTAEEQKRFFLDFTNYTAEKLPLLCQMSDAWTDSKVKCFEEGLVYLQAFSYCRDFVQKTLYWRDFSRRVNRLIYLTNKVRDEISQGRGMKTAEGKTVVTLEEDKKPKRGRPSKAKSEAKGEAKTAVADSSTAVSSAPSASPTMSPAHQTAAQVAGTERLTLGQLSWLLSAETQNEVKQVQFLRTTATAESEQAKALAENNVPEELIRPHSEATVKAMESIQRIYNRVDMELAEVYYRLSQDNDFGGFKAAWEKKNGIFSELLELLLPYYNKMGGEEFAASLKTNDQVKAEKEAQSKAAAERSQKIHTARTYITRNDQALTSERLGRMKEYLEECRKLGYDKVAELEKIVADAEKQIEEEIANRPDLFAALNNPEPETKPAAKGSKKK